jgi:hypothetical protein
MTTAATGLATVFRRAAVAEWTRLLTVRSTWWSLLAGAALMLFIGAAMGSDHSGGDPAPIWAAAQIAMVPGHLLFLVVVLLAVTGEYGTGAIRSSLQWVPRRGVLLAARVLVPIAFATACAVVVSTTTNLLAWGFLGRAAEVVPGDIAASLGRITLVVAFSCAVTVGLGLLLRSTAGTLAAIFLLVLALPIALGNSGVGWLIAISDRLPGRAIVSMLVVDEVQLTSGTVAVVMISWTIVALLVGGWSLIRRDTT